jgi:hypothetical protein
MHKLGDRLGGAARLGHFLSPAESGFGVIVDRGAAENGFGMSQATSPRPPGSSPTRAFARTAQQLVACALRRFHLLLISGSWSSCPGGNDDRRAPATSVACLQWLELTLSGDSGQLAAGSLPNTASRSPLTRECRSAWIPRFRSAGRHFALPAPPALSRRRAPSEGEVPSPRTFSISLRVAAPSPSQQSVDDWYSSGLLCDHSLAVVRRDEREALNGTPPYRPARDRSTRDTALAGGRGGRRGQANLCCRWRVKADQGAARQVGLPPPGQR